MRGRRGGRGDHAAAQADLAPAGRRGRCGPRPRRSGRPPLRDGPLSGDRPLPPRRGLMRRLLFLPVLVLLVSSRPSPIAAQTGPQPNLVLTLFGGAVSGHFLWGIDRQPLCVLQGSGGVFSCTSLYDTLTLSRKVSASIVAGASGSYFKSAHVGVQGEIYYLGFS